MFLILAIAARALSTDDMALVVLASTLGWLLALATDFGLQVYLAREIARDPLRAGDALWPMVRVRAWTLLTGLAVAVVVAAISQPLAVVLPFAGIACGYLLGSVVEFLNYAFRGLGRTDMESWATLGQRGGSLALAAVLLPLWPSLSAVAIALIVPPILTALVIGRHLTHAAPMTGASGRPPLGALWRGVAPIGAGIVLSGLSFRVDAFLLAWWSTPEAVASYGAMFRLMDAARILPAAVLAVLLPQMFRGRDTALFGRVSAGLLAFGTASALALYAAAPFVAALAFGPAYASAAPMLRSLCLALPLLTLNYGLTTQLIGWNGQRAFAAINAGALAINVALNARWIPHWGGLGAAWATTATEAAITVSCLVALRASRGAAVRVDGDRR